jgi:hypothetical protein
LFRDTHIILRDKREEGAKCLGKVCAQSFGQSSHKVSSRRDENGIKFGLIFRSFVVLILIWVLLAKSLLFKYLNGNAANGVKF